MVDLLPEDQREVIILRHYADLSFKEIADLTNCSINTALGRMRYGLINLRKMMTEKQIALYNTHSHTLTPIPVKEGIICNPNHTDSNLNMYLH